MAFDLTHNFSPRKFSLPNQPPPPQLDRKEHYYCVHLTRGASVEVREKIEFISFAIMIKLREIKCDYKLNRGVLSTQKVRGGENE